METERHLDSRYLRGSKVGEPRWIRSYFEAKAPPRWPSYYVLVGHTYSSTGQFVVRSRAQLLNYLRAAVACAASGETVELESSVSVAPTRARTVARKAPPKRQKRRSDPDDVAAPDVAASAPAAPAARRPLGDVAAEALETVASAFLADPSKVLIVTGAGVERECLRDGTPTCCDAHCAIAALREASGGDVALVTMNISGLHFLAEAPSLGTRNVVEVHRTIWDSRCSARGCRRPIHAPRAPAFEATRMTCCGRPTYGCVPTGDPRDRDSAEFQRATEIARSRGERATVVVLGSSLGYHNGGGLGWLQAVPSVRAVVVVDPNVPDTDDAEWHGKNSVRERLSKRCKMRGSVDKKRGSDFETFLVVRTDADAFARDLATSIGLEDLVATARDRGAASTALKNRSLPTILAGENHGFTDTVRAAFARGSSP